MSYSFLSVKVPESLHRQLKKQAVEEKRTMIEIVQELFQKYLEPVHTAEPLPEPVHTGEPLCEPIQHAPLL
ncbi:hypothetical protein QUA69_27295 [Microcoleus sp. LAD1_D1]|uniref:hypothetical protein n=1 Tax=Microcoleus sp. LAD1_D1 TaxID=2818812 RepID=UPI002FCFA76B